MKKQLDALPEDATAVVMLSNIESTAVDLMLQWVETGRIKLSEKRYRLGGHQIDALVQFVDAACSLGVKLDEKEITEYFNEIFLQDRTALRSVHIRWAYEVQDDRSGPVDPADFAQLQRQNILRSMQLLFTKVACKEFLLYKDNPMATPYGEPVYYPFEAGVDEARRTAFNNGFRFDRDMKAIREFKYDLLDLFDQTWRTREYLTKDTTNTSRRCFIDPLTGKRFIAD